MREILFRGKRKDTGEWAYGYFVSQGAETYIFEQTEVDKGIEAVSKVMMPVLVVLTIFIAGYSMFMPGAMDGLAKFFIPNFSASSCIDGMSWW